jgi:hypothetical protein
VVAAQPQVKQLEGTFSLTERFASGLRREYRGQLLYRAPESAVLTITQTAAPSGWLENTSTLAIAGEQAYIRRPFPCPDLHGCEGAAPRQQAVVGRDPFSTVTPAPLDLVVPTSIFADTREPVRLADSVIAGQDVIGVEITAAQARPLLSALFSNGNWREIHSTDRVELWLHNAYYTPLGISIYAGADPDRAAWAARRGYDDPQGAPYLELRYQTIDFSPTPGAIALPPGGGDPVEAGFRPQPLGDPPLDTGMQLVASGRIEGTVVVEVWAWSDGRAWIRLDRTKGWAGTGLFGNLGGLVRPVLSSRGPVYVGEDEAKVFVHGEAADAVLSGSVGSERLLELAASLDLDPRLVPSTWPEAVAVQVPPGVLLPSGLAGFRAPVVHAGEEVVVVDLIGTDRRSARITQRPGDLLSPPFDPDARAVVVRSTAGRYSPQLGLLEWTEDGISLGVSSATLSLAELLTIAQSLQAR